MVALEPKKSLAQAVGSGKLQRKAKRAQKEGEVLFRWKEKGCESLGNWRHKEHAVSDRRGQRPVGQYSMEPSLGKGRVQPHVKKAKSSGLGAIRKLSGEDLRP